ncbi:MAG: DUF6503 family protein [Bacteroidota bacterium]
MNISTHFKALSLLVVLIAAMACQEKAEQQVAQVSTYPEALQKVLEKHGGLAAWQAFKGMQYQIQRGESFEQQFVDLEDRREKIEGRNFISGFDGENYWVKADSTYKGNPIFYKNLMFYFYAMPFVVADPGIRYETAPELTVEGKVYPGIRISYEDGVGVSSKDEYFLHYDPETFNMQWLGYTVTYRTQEVSDKIKWIRYQDWQEVNGLQLPKNLDWFHVEENQPTSLRNSVPFQAVNLSQDKFADETFLPVEGAEMVEE